ncbi:putative reverse transcriptase domain-containing protein [Tanacetum coccineum]
MLYVACKVEEKMTLKEVDRKTIQEFKTKIIDKDGTITRVSGTFQGYETSEEESVERPREVEQPRRHDLYGFVDHPQLQQGNPMNEFAPHRLPQPKGNMNGWLIEDEEEVERNEVDSDLESTASSKPVWKKTTKADHDRASRNCLCNYPYCSKCYMEYDGKGGAIALTRWIEKMENVIDNSGCAENQKVRYATSSLVNKALTWWNTQCQARGRVAAMAISWNDFKALMVEEFCPITPESSRIKRYIAGLAPEIRGMLRATQPTTIQTAILRAGILTDEAVSCGTLTKGSDKRKGVEEPSKTGGSGKDNKWAKTGTRFVATTPTRNEAGNSNPKCNKCFTHHPINGFCRLCFNYQKPGHFARDCRAPVRQVAPVNAVRMSNNSRVRGRAFNVNVNAMEAVQDPKVVTGTFSLNDHFVTVLFDSGADFSFVSTKFAPLLNVKPSIVNPGYVIEVADGKKVEVDRVIRDYKLELGGSLFSINLIPLGHGSFDVIVGMDWLSQHKAVIVCHDKVVEIPVENGKILRVHGERAVGITKALKSAKEEEPKLNDISVVHEFEDVFPEDLSGLPP